MDADRSSALVQSAAVWSSRDLLLNGEFCPPNAIASALEDHLQSSEAGWMVLGTFDRVGVLRTLTFASALDSHTQRQLEENIEQASLRSYTAKVGADTTNLLTADEHEVLMYLADEGRDLFAGVPGQPSLAFGDREYARRQGVSFFLVSDRPLPPLDTAFETSIAEMLNGTLIANVRRDQRIARSINKAGQRSAGHDPGAVKPVLDRLVELARDATSSDFAAYFDVDGANMRMTRVTSAGAPTDSIPQSVPVKNGIGTVPDAFDDPIAHMIQKSAADTATYVQVARDDGAGGRFPTFVCLAVPADPVGRGTPNLGVLLLCRYPDPDASTPTAREARFSSFDLALTRNVALRISLLTAMGRGRRASQVLTALTLTSSTRSLPSPVQPTGGSVPPHEMIPWDLHVATPELSAMLRELAEVTMASSVTMRALSYSRFEMRNHLVLRRFIAFPPERLDDELDDIPLTSTDRGPAEQNSSNAHAAVTGIVVHVRDAQRLRDPGTRAGTGVPGLGSVREVEGRPALGSTITLPVIVDGTTVATINLESPMKRAFQLHEDTCRAAASLASVIISNARASQVRDLARIAAELGVGPHDAVNVEDKLTKIADVLPPDLMPHIDDIREIVLKKPSKDERGVVPTGFVSLAGLVESEMAPAIKVTVSDRHEVPARLEPTFREILRECFRNLQDHSDAHRSHLRQVRDTSFELNGTELTALVFRNAPLAQPNMTLLRQAFHVPIHRSEDTRPHVGLFSIGESLRHMGGGAFMTLGGDWSVETVLYFPAFKEATT